MFYVDIKASLVLGIVFLIIGVWFSLYRKKEPRRPSISFSHTGVFDTVSKSWRVRCVSWPRILQCAALVCFALAFLDPHVMREVVPDEEEKRQEESSLDDYTVSTEGLTIFLVLDQSGSMGNVVPFLSAETGQRLNLPKMEALKYVTSQFISGNPAFGLEGRSHDLIGLVSFARVAEILSPPTLHHDEILDALSGLNIVDNRDRDGTAIGYAVYKTANMIEATRRFSEKMGTDIPYDSTSTIIIVVTDGIQTPHPADAGHELREMSVRESAEYASEYGIKLYVINIEPAFRQRIYRSARKEMEEATEMTGGKFFIADGAGNLQAVYREIEELEKGEVPLDVVIDEVEETVLQNDENKEKVAFFPFLIACGLFSLCCSIIMSTCIVRRVQ